jgi:hypothetical protein
VAGGGVSVDAATVAERAARVRDRIAAAGGDPAAVTLVAVTKRFGPEVVRAALDAGLADVGENYAQELAAKAAEVGDGPRWHFVGVLQRNKVRTVAGLVHLWQSVDRLGAGQEIAKRAPGAAVLAQVDLAGLPGRGGCPPEQVPDLVAGLRDLGLDVRGLMAVGPPGDPEDARPGFRLVRELADRLGLPERSMGMTGDLEVAVAEGSTMVRVGTALFGPRAGSDGLRHYA